MRSRQTESEYWTDFLRKQEIKDEVDDLKIIPECKWKELKINDATRWNFRCTISKFFNQEKISQDDLVNAVRNDEFFGLIKVKITSPPAVVEKYKSLNMPFIFNKQQITETVQFNSYQF